MRLRKPCNSSFLRIYHLLGLMILLPSLLSGVHSFTLLTTAPSSRTSSIIRHHFQQTKIHPLTKRRSTTTSLNCICINCKYVTNCQAYHFVEEKHEQPHMTENPTFEPRDGSPTIHVNVRTIRSATSDNKTEFERMMEEHEEETAKAEAKAAASGSDDDSAAPLHGSTKYDLTPMATYEYDVVACADYVEDMGCWVRNMPQAIKDANPDFVPT